MIDKELMLRDGTSALDANEQAEAGINFGSVDGKEGFTYTVYVPSAGGSSPTLDLKIQESDNGSTWRDFLALPQITAAGIYRVTGRSDANWRRHYATVGGTSPDFGNVIIAPELGGEYDSF